MFRRRVAFGGTCSTADAFQDAKDIERLAEAFRPRSYTVPMVPLSHFRAVLLPDTSTGYRSTFPYMGTWEKRRVILCGEIRGGA
jgi:hypothetical protein